MYCPSACAGRFVKTPISVKMPPASADSMADAPKIPPPERSPTFVVVRRGLADRQTSTSRIAIRRFRNKKYRMEVVGSARLNGRDRPANAPQVVLDRREGAG
jgi:hypothetical protein